MDDLEQKVSASSRPLRVLVGDDEIGIDGSLHQRAFLMRYSALPATYDFAAAPEAFLEKAARGAYDALLVDLNWTPEDLAREEKTGYRLIQAARGYAPVRILHTTDVEHASAAGGGYGATGAAQKHRNAQYLWSKLTGGEPHDTPRRT